MSTLTAATQRRGRNWGPSIHQNFRVDNSATIFVGAFTGLPGANALTSDRGYLVEWQNQVNLQWAGIAIAESATNSLSTSNTVVGDTSASPVVELAVETGAYVLEQYTVTGVSAQTDVWRTAVYGSNDNDLTTTAGYPAAIGRVLYWYSSTTCDVLLFGMLGHLLFIN